MDVMSLFKSMIGFVTYCDYTKTITPGEDGADDVVSETFKENETWSFVGLLKNMCMVYLGALTADSVVR